MVASPAALEKIGESREPGNWMTKKIAPMNSGSPPLATAPLRISERGLAGTDQVEKTTTSTRLVF